PERAVGAWLLSLEDGLVLKAGIAPTSVLGVPQRNTLTRTMAPLVQQSAIWLPISDGSTVVTLLSLELSASDDVEPLVRLTSAFASQLSAQLQVNAAPSKPSVGSADTTSVGVAVCPICLTCYDGTSKDKCVADGADLRHDFKGVSPV